MKLIIRIIHAVSTENSFQAAFIKGLVVRYQWQAFNAWSYFLPHNGKDRSIPGICQRQTMHAGIPISVILRFGTDEVIIMVHNLSITYDNHSYTTNAGTLFVGRFKINGSKIFHPIWFYSRQRYEELAKKRQNLDK